MCRPLFPILVVVFAMAVMHRCCGQESEAVDPSVQTTSPSIDELMLFFPAKYPNCDWNPKELRFQDVHLPPKTEPSCTDGIAPSVIHVP